MTHHGHHVHHHGHHHHNRNGNTNIIIAPSIGYGMIQYFRPSYYSGTYTRGSFIVVILVIIIFIIVLVVSLVRKKTKHENFNSQISSDKRDKYLTM